MARRREKIVTLRMNEKSYQIIKDYASNHGLSVNAYLNSVIDSQAEWFIPTSSYAAVTVPKSMISILFSMVDKERLRPLAEKWAAEAKNIILLSGSDLSISSAVNFIRIISRYFMSADARVTLSNGETPSQRNSSIVIRHDAGENFSYFCAQSFINLFALLEVKAKVSYDDTTIFIRLEV